LTLEFVVPIDVFLMVLAAALVHATWNALVKTDSDRLALIRVLSFTQFALSLCLVPFVPAPAPQSWPYLAASTVLSTGYMLFLNRAYQTADLSLVYPLARGVAPFIVAVVSVGLLGEQLGRASQLAILLIGLGITSLALARGSASLRDWRPMVLALVTGSFIGAYTIVDGLGVRAAGSAHGYMIWLTLASALLIVACTSWLQRGRRARLNPRSRAVGVAAGIMSYGSAWVVMWALSLAPLALVSALRETGIVFAVIIGIVFLKERVNLARLASIALTLIGTALLKLSR
jgi:drug/metabolite transporter (DMT)-like permease